MKLNQSSLVCSRLFSLSFSLFLSSFAHCMYACIRVHACVCVESLAILFSRVVFPRRVARRGTASTFFISPLPVFAFRNSPSLHHRIFYYLYLIIISTMRVCIYVYVQCTCSICAVYMLCAYICISISILFSLSYYYIYHGIICVQIAASQRNKRYSRHLDTLLVMG